MCCPARQKQQVPAQVREVPINCSHPYCPHSYDTHHTHKKPYNITLLHTIKRHAAALHRIAPQAVAQAVRITHRTKLYPTLWDPAVHLWHQVQLLVLLIHQGAVVADLQGADTWQRQQQRPRQQSNMVKAWG